MPLLIHPSRLELIVRRLALQLTENPSAYASTVFVGIQPRGVPLCERIVAYLKETHPGHSYTSGSLDITFYRDDIREELHVPRETSLFGSVEGKRVILIDDVLYTGRTIRAAMDAIQDFGRPAKVELCILVNRRFNRELPIQPDYCGLAVDTRPEQKIRVHWERGEVEIQ